jgi:ubiquinone/menaquinone biosynthesis C-methylase UbiE
MTVPVTQAERGDWRSQVLEVRRDRDWDLRFYSRVAPVYEVWATLAESKARRRVLKLAEVRDRQAVLEVAVGTGKQLAALALRNPYGRTVGVDLAEGMLARARRRLARERLEGVEVRRGDALALPFADASFDLVVNSYMLDLLPRADIAGALGEFRRVLHPGGRLVLSNMTKGRRRWHRLYDALYARGLSLTANCRGVLAVPVLAELGFVEVRREYLTQLLVPTEIVTARKPQDELKDPEVGQ